MNLTRPSQRRLVPLALAGLCLGGLWAWAVAPDPGPDDYVAYPAHEYFPLMVEGWLQGQLALPLPVPDGLQRLADPYNPAANEAYRYAGRSGLHDLSLYRGQLYLYWGPAPALLVFLPWRLLTGSGLSTAWAVWLLVFTGWLFASMLVLHIVERFYQKTAGAVILGALFIVGLGNFAAVVLTRASVYEVSIAAAYCLTSLAWWQLAVAMWQPPSQRATALTITSLALGLAVASRPSWIIVAPALLAALWDLRHQWRLPVFRSLSAHALVPIMTCVGALLLYNELRFDDPVEFGTRYQLMAQHPGSDLFSLAHIPASVCMYLLTPPGTTDYFPFLRPLPAQDVWHSARHAEATFGLLPLLPVLWLVPLVWSAGRKACLRRLMLVLSASFVGVLIVLAAFHFGVTLRYALDLAPLLALLAVVGLLELEDSFCKTRLLRCGIRGLWVMLVIASLGMTLCAVYSREPVPRSTEPSRIAHLANAAAQFVGWTPDGFIRQLEIEIMLPVDIPPSKEEVIIATGRSPYHNVLYLRRPDPGHVVVGFHRGDRERDESDPLPVDPNVPHTMRLELGSLSPPSDHPYWADFDSDTKEAMHTRVHVVLNDRVMLSGNRFQWPAADVRPVYGDLPWGSGGANRFTGRWLGGQEHRQRFSPEAPGHSGN